MASTAGTVPPGRRPGLLQRMSLPGACVARRAFFVVQFGCALRTPAKRGPARRKRGHLMNRSAKTIQNEPVASGAKVPAQSALGLATGLEAPLAMLAICGLAKIVAAAIEHI